MSRLTDIIAKQRKSGKGVAASLGTGIKERLKEKLDPRNMFDQQGMMTALFPSLKAYKYKGVKGDVSVEDDSLFSRSPKSIDSSLSKVEINTGILAKNTMVLPAMHRDINVMRQNIVKLVKLSGGKATTKADMHFMNAKTRNAAFKVQSTPKNVKADDLVGEEEKKGGLAEFLTGILETIKGIGGMILKPITEALGKLPDLLMKGLKGMFNLGSMTMRFIGPILMRVLSFFVSPVGLAVLLGAAALFGLASWLEQNTEWGKEYAKNKKRQPKDVRSIAPPGESQKPQSTPPKDKADWTQKEIDEETERRAVKKTDKAFSDPSGFPKWDRTEPNKLTEWYLRSLHINRLDIKEEVKKEVEEAKKARGDKPTSNSPAPQPAKEGGAQPDAKAPNAPTKVGPPMDKSSTLAIGDSLASGLIGTGKVSGKSGSYRYGATNEQIMDYFNANKEIDAIPSRWPSHVLESIEANLKKDPDYYKGKNVILGTGAPNNTKEIGLVEKQIDLLKGAGATVTVLGAGDREDFNKIDLNGKLKAIADKKGVKFTGPLSNVSPLLQDRVHSANYNTLLNNIIKDSKTTPEAPPANSKGSAADKHSRNIQVPDAQVQVAENNNTQNAPKSQQQNPTSVIASTYDEEMVRKLDMFASYNPMSA